ncbi:MAG: tripartite tricarboxylate transporter substrate binding protein [Burkholderiales bacterium]|jgi:tripartite-type tricarboxylate transporter receptor subunit TctC|nr:tripartite tricarboxylate transporter substrate binding protein [Burkholderiales bacterium]
MKRRSIVTLACAGMLGALGPADAQSKFPFKTMQLSVPTAGGSAGDLWARALLSGWADDLGQPMIVDNRPGGGGMISIDYVAHSAPDGHTLLMGNSSLVTNQLAFKKVSYDPFNDFVPIGRIGIAPIVFVVDPALGITTMQQFIQAAKGKDWNYGSFAVGSPQHLFGLLLSQHYGLDMTHIVYKGESALMPDLLTGRIQCGFITVTSAKSFVRSGKIKALGVLTPQRSPSLPEVPTLVEAGLDKRFAWNGWIAVFAPARTPADVQARLSASMEATLKRPDVRKKLEEQDMLVAWASPAELLQMEKDSLEAMRTLRNLANLKPED